MSLFCKLDNWQLLRMFKLTEVFVSLSLFVFNVDCSLPTVRQTQNGPVEGIEQISILGHKFYAFKGIPYAEPPITGIDPYTGKQVDRRFKVNWNIFFWRVISAEVLLTVIELIQRLQNHSIECGLKIWMWIILPIVA